MASIGHIAVGLAGRRWYERGVRPRWAALTAMVVWSSLSLAPDADVIGFRFGVAYADPWGHRGATHSLAFALAVALLVAIVMRWTRLPPLRTGLCVFVVLASHGLLDALTDGGLGPALLWPFSNERIFAPITPLPVAPIGRRFLSRAGLLVAATEALFFLPFFVYGLWPQRRRSKPAVRDAANS